MADLGYFQLGHLAAHGQLNPVNPLFSRIVLAPGGDADGLLEVHEIYGLDLAKASLIVLSACQTQMGAQSRGDDVVGLSRAFIYAGAPTVIASLWKVDDKATSYLMTSLYTNLKKGMGKAAALWAAQAKTRAKVVGKPSPGRSSTANGRRRNGAALAAMDDRVGELPIRGRRVPRT